MSDQSKKQLPEYLLKRESADKSTKPIHIHEDLHGYIKEVSSFFNIEMKHLAENIIQDWIENYKEDIKTARNKRAQERGY